MLLNQTAIVIVLSLQASAPPVRVPMRALATFVESEQTIENAGSDGDETDAIKTINRQFKLKLAQFQFAAAKNAKAAETQVDITTFSNADAEHEEMVRYSTLTLTGASALNSRAVSAILNENESLLIAKTTIQEDHTVRFFGPAKRAEIDKETNSNIINTSNIANNAPVRRGSVYPISSEGHRLDAFFIRDAKVASEALPSGEGLSIAGAGDRPRRFMRGHRYQNGAGTIVGIRYADPFGGTLKISIELPKDAKGEYSLPAKDANLYVTELSPDLKVGRISERITGNIQFQPKAEGGATLQIALDVELRRIGAREPQRLILFGEYACVSVSVAELTPWLGMFTTGRPVLESFAMPDAVILDAANLKHESEPKTK
ncbi:MAG: hypothetical protein ACKVS6_10620 [Planctomycetota bacterium]